MPVLRYRIVNVFAESRLAGNPLCVFEDGAAIDSATMQALALQFNLSETTFILPAGAPDATARVRIFTPTFEMPFAGHPTLGTAHVVRELMRPGDAVKLQMDAGVIPVTAEGDVWTLQANAPRSHAPAATRDQFAHMLGVETSDVLDAALWVDSGSEQLVIPLASVRAVDGCRPDPGLLARYSVGNKRQGLAYVWAWVDESTVRARFFFLKHGGVVEDAGTGSACANLGGWFVAQQASLPLALDVRQGDHVGRPCRLYPARGRRAANLRFGARHRTRARGSRDLSVQRAGRHPCFSFRASAHPLTPPCLSSVFPDLAGAGIISPVVRFLPANPSWASSGVLPIGHNPQPARRRMNACWWSSRQELDMVQMKQQRGDQRISVDESWALRYWTRELGVTETELRDTVEAVGPKVEDVRKVLNRQ